MRYILLLTILCCNVFGFNVEPGQKLPPNITYSCPPEMEQNFLEAFCTWNLACNNIFTLEKVDSNPVITVGDPSTMSNVIPNSQVLGFTAYYGNTAKIIIVENKFSVMLHEVGHALGMAHSDFDGDSVMFPTNNQGYLSQDDVAGICSIYGQSPLKWDFSFRKHSTKVLCLSAVPVDWIWGDGTTTLNSTGKIVHKYPFGGYYTLKCVRSHISVSHTVRIK